MSYIELPDNLKHILQMHRRPDEVFTELMPALVHTLQCDRCFLYLRHPKTRWARHAYCWRADETLPDVTEDWLQENPAELEDRDPLFAASLRGEPSIFVDDVETADPDVVNLEYERQHYGHRALIHGHIYETQGEDQGLWGVLQPCVFHQPRHWTQYDRSVILFTMEQITPLVIDHVKQNSPA